MNNLLAMWFISAFLTCFVYVYGLLWDNPKYLLWQQVTPNSKQSSCVPQAQTFHLFSAQTQSKMHHDIYRLPLPGVTHKLEAGHWHPQTSKAPHPPRLFRLAVCFSIVDSNDYTWSLKSCMCGFIFWFKECLRTTVVTINNFSHHVAGHHCQVPQVRISHTIWKHKWHTWQLV